VSCLVCHGPDVEEFLDLGHTALANKFLAPDEVDADEPTYPLRVGRCSACGHVQLLDRIPPSALFEDYLYVSGASDTLRAHFEDLAEGLTADFGLTERDLVVDIGCNDASLLQCFRRRGTRTLGVDPARNLAEYAAGSGIDRYTGFFGAATAQEIRDRWGPAQLVTATNTFPHLPDLDDFLQGIDTLLAPGGRFVIEAHYLVDLLDQLAFDTVYHEHVSYWALRPLMTLCARHGMEVVRVERLDLHHGQLRAVMQRAGEGSVDSGVEELARFEVERGLDRAETFTTFAARVASLRHSLRDHVAAIHRDERRLAAYGAPAKGSTLLEYLGLGPEDIEYIADRSPLKQGRLTPGSRIPIVAPERLLEDQPDYVLLLAWNFADEVMEQQREYRSRGGKFLLPVPEVRVA
jgi:SAM-dependent methyltransferase